LSQLVLNHIDEEEESLFRQARLEIEEDELPDMALDYVQTCKAYLESGIKVKSAHIYDPSTITYW